MRDERAADPPDLFEPPDPGSIDDDDDDDDPDAWDGYPDPDGGEVDY